VDVVILGAGLAGTAAALAAAEAGAQTTLVEAAPGASALAHGGLDLLPGGLVADAQVCLDPPPTLGPRRSSLRRRWEELRRERPEHSLCRMELRLEELAEAALLFDDLLGGGLRGWRGPERAPYLLATEGGALREVDLPAPAARAGDLEGLSSLRVGIVGLPELPDFDPSFLAGVLGQRCQGADRFVPLLPEIEFASGGALRALSLARLLDRDDGAGLAQALAQMTPGLGLSHLMLPPVLGLERSAQIRQSLHEATGLQVFEAVAERSPCPALRTRRALDAALASFEVTRLAARALGAELLDRRVLALHLQPVDGAGVLRVPLDSLVLATGDLYGGGLQWRAGLREALLDLPVVPGDGSAPALLRRPLHRALGTDPAAVQPAFAAGLAVDGRLQPLGADALPAARNVWACGALLAGHDPGAERGGSGVAWLSGRQAGRFAAGGGA